MKIELGKTYIDGYGIERGPMAWNPKNDPDNQYMCQRTGRCYGHHGMSETESSYNPLDLIGQGEKPLMAPGFDPDSAELKAFEYSAII